MIVEPAEMGPRPEEVVDVRAGQTPLPVSVVVVTYNSAHCIEQCLASITERLQPAEVVVVDNASDDGSLERVRRAMPDAVVIESDLNLGFGRACNLGVARARCGSVLFVNPDVVLSHVNRRDLDVALGQPTLGLLVPLLSNGSETSARHQIFPYRWWRRVVFEQAWSGLRPRELMQVRRPARSPRNAWAVAALLFVRREEFLSVGGFDPRYFLYGEDLDLSRRYRERGLGVRLTDSVIGRHSESASSTLADRLRIAPLAWSLLGTLECLSVWEGEDVARRGASIVLRSFRVQRLLLRQSGRIPWLRDRASRKAQQIEEIEAFLRAHAEIAGGALSASYCPGARAALGSVMPAAPSR